MKPRFALPARLRLRTPFAATIAAGTVVTGIVVTLALLAPGYATQEVEVNDSSVWVTSGSPQMVGLANTQLAKLSTAVSTKSASLDVVQGQGRMLVHDTSSNTLDVYDPATVTTLATVPLPEGTPQLAPAGSQLLMYQPENGDVWMSRYEDLTAFSHKSPAVFSLGVDAVLAADELDRYVGYSSKSGEVRIGTLDGAPTYEEAGFDGGGTRPQASLVGGKPVVYDPDAGQVWIDGTIVSVASVISSPDTALLMEPTTTNGRVLIAFDGGLVAIDGSNGQVTTLSDESGPAAKPVRLGSCDFAAWSGTAYKDCGVPDTFALDGAAKGTPRLAVNGRTVVATDPDTGLTWAIQRTGERIDNWSDFVEESEILEQQQQINDVPLEKDPDQKPPNALDDEFGIRAGRANKLPVLLNDFDPNGDALVITGFSDLDPAFGRLDLITDDQQIQITTPPEASGSTSFTYTISDGYGNEATATVHLTVHGPEVNNPPQQIRSTRTSVATGGTTTTSVLDDWVDPESDPIFLADASIDPDGVSFTPDGVVEFVDGGGAEKLKNITIAVSDGTTVGYGTLGVTVNPVGMSPIIAENFALTGYIDQEIIVEPLPEARGGSGPITLNTAKPGPGDETLTVTPDYAAGSFIVSSSQPGTHFVEYSVTDGAESASAYLRLEVRQPPDEMRDPVTVPTTAFLTLRDTQLVDVLATDYDPAGGVLSITGVEGRPQDDGVVVEIVEQRILRVTLGEERGTEPLTLTYQVTNGHSSATGTLTLIEIADPPKLQAPVAKDDSVTVRVGSVVDIPVLENDRHPNGKPLILAPELVKEVGQGEGTLVTSGNILRYLAPDRPGEYSASYKVSSIDGQWATGNVSITVREIDKANNNAPRPKTITTRVGAGQMTTIPIPLGSIDPDGDLVTLLGQASAPEHGAITAVGSTWIEYTASKFEPGTDTFSYSVVDDLGATATGTIRVGIAPDAGESAPPIAMDDIVTVQPGTQLGIDVIANDSDPIQSPIKVVGIEDSDQVSDATHTDSTIKLTAPKEPGSYGFLYTINNAAGLSSRAWLFLQVDEDAPLLAPSAHDVVLSLEEIDGHTVVDADVLSAVTFSEGTSKSLQVTLPEDVTQAEVTDAKKVSVEVTPMSRIIPFTVARSDDPNVSSTAFLWVPGTEDARPQVRTDVPALKVVSGERLTIPVNNFVIAAGKKTVTLDDLASITATYSDNSPLWSNNTTLVFTSKDAYWGPASITFTVTDGRNKATLNLPITVLPAEDQAPTINSAAVDLEAGQETTLDLWGLTDYPGERSDLTYSAVDDDKSIVAATVSGSELTLRAVEGAKVGQQAKVTVTVRDKAKNGPSKAIAVTIVASTRPTVVAVPDEVTIRRGAAETVNVLDNDSATNPFPGKPLRVVSVGSQVPAGVKVTPSADRRTVSISVSSDANTGSVTIPYQVADVTDDPDRYVTGTIIAKIQDVPDAPTGGPRVASKNDEKATVTLAIPHAFPNFSDITEYVVTTADGATAGTCTNPDACTVSNLTYGQPYQFAAYAINGIGEGAPSPLSESVIVDVVPNPPASVALAATAQAPEGNSLQVTWSDSGQSGKGTAIEGYDILLSGPGVSLNTTAGAGETSKVLSDSGISPGASYDVSVRARNKTHSGEPRTASAVAVGPPSIANAFAMPTADNRIQVAISAGNANGAGHIAYSVTPGASGAPDGSPCDVGAFQSNTSGSTWTGGADSWQEGAQFTVQASNGLFCRVYTSTQAPARPTATGSVGLTPLAGDDLGVRNLYINSLGPAEGVDHFEYRLRIDGGGETSWAPVAAAGGMVSHADAYGRATTVIVRACFGTVAATCGAEAEIGTVTPVYTRVTDRGCVAGGPASFRSGNNNGQINLNVQLRYVLTEQDGSTTVGDWVPNDINAPRRFAGQTLHAEWRSFDPGSPTPSPYPPTSCS